MKADKHHFQLLNGRSVVVDQECTFGEIRRLGDNLATAQNHQLKEEAFNFPHNNWDFLGTFLGNRQFQNWDRDRWVINKDYKGMTRMTARKEEAAV